MAGKKHKVRRVVGLAMRFNEEDSKLLNELQSKFGTTEISSTIREAMIRAGEAEGIKIVRIAEGVGYRVELQG